MTQRRKSTPVSRRLKPFIRWRPYPDRRRGTYGPQLRPTPPWLYSLWARIFQVGDPAVTPSRKSDPIPIAWGSGVLADRGLAYDAEFNVAVLWVNGMLNLGTLDRDALVWRWV